MKNIKAELLFVEDEKIHIVCAFEGTADESIHRDQESVLSRSSSHDQQANKNLAEQNVSGAVKNLLFVYSNIAVSM